MIGFSLLEPHKHEIFILPSGEPCTEGMLVGVNRAGEVVPAKNDMRIAGVVAPDGLIECDKGEVAIRLLRGGFLAVARPEPVRGKRLGAATRWARLNAECTGVEAVDSAQEADFLILRDDEATLTLALVAKRGLLA